MKIGVLKEIKNHEGRIGLTPSSVKELMRHGHMVMVEAKAGEKAGFTDGDYRSMGALIAESSDKIFEDAELIIKVKEPQAQEYTKLKDGQILFTFLHLAADLKQTKGLIASNAIALAYETLTTTDGKLPLLAPMSAIAGRMAIQVGAYYLQKEGKGILLSGIPGVAPGRVTIIGGGNVGTNAARMAIGLGADVTVLDKSLQRLNELEEIFSGRLKTLYANPESLKESLINADLVVGAVLVPGFSAPKLIQKDLIAKMGKGSVIVDVAIDQGGCFETSRPTTHDDPIFLENGVFHYCVTNMPGAVSKTSSLALNHATFPYILAIANKGLKKACIEDPALLSAINIYRGHVTCQPVAQALNIPYFQLNEQNLK